LLLWLHHRHRGWGRRSGDPNLLNWYKENKDAYLEMAKLAYPEDDLDADPDLKAYYRSMFKVGFLADLYNESAYGLAGHSDLSVEEAQEVKDMIAIKFPVVKSHANEMSEYPLNNNYRVNTVLGDKKLRERGR
jgi:DNA polymerase I-like protein with 3'-5' exonuclease and polymerase domains